MKQQMGRLQVIKEQDQVHPDKQVSLTDPDARSMAKANEYICPAGERLTYRYDSEEKGKTLWVYWTSRCSDCPLKADCTTGKERRIKRWEKEHILEAAAAFFMAGIFDRLCLCID
jgi:hypothetical protein